MISASTWIECLHWNPQCETDVKVIQDDAQKEPLAILSKCLAYLRTTATKEDYESACRLLGKEPT